MSHRRKSLLDEMGEAAAAAAAAAAAELGEDDGEEMDSMEADDDFEEDEEDFYADGNEVDDGVAMGAVTSASIFGTDELVVVEECEEDSTEPSMGTEYDQLVISGRIAPPPSTSLIPLQEEGAHIGATNEAVGQHTGPTALDFEYYYDEGSSSLASGISSDTSFWEGGGASGHRRSLASFNSTGNASEADLSINSAPVVMRRESGRSSLGGPSSQTPSRVTRRVTINVPRDSALGEIDSPLRSSIGRPRRTKLYGSTRAFLGGSRADDSSASSSIIVRTKRSVLGRRISSQLRQSGSSWESGSLAAAADRLGNHENKPAWESAVAAAAVVAASAQAPSKRQHVQYGKHDYVLVLLNLLNITNHEDDRSLFTVEPVNAFGYPAGEGKTEEERQGPFSYLLCCVSEVHFDEDERYYTVMRLDTSTNQRADPGWMEPLPPHAENWEAAERAAKRTSQSQAEVTNDDVKYHREIFLLTPWRFIQSAFCPWYHGTRAASKMLAENILWGKPGCACRLHITVINLLVLASFIYLFIETFSLAFLPESLDHGAAIVELVVWCILVIELFLEYIIRPAGYHKLILSDKAYAPATARHINFFHLFFESIALLLFTPRFFCIAQRETCGDRFALSLVSASFNAVVGRSYATVAFGRLVLGLTFLRTFGLVRHWKQMWINSTFIRYRESGTESAIMRQLLLLRPDTTVKGLNFFRRKKLDDDQDWHDDQLDHPTHPSSEEERKLQMNAKIGTALMLINSHRALVIMLSIFTIFPIIYSIGKTNVFAYKQVRLLQANNVAANHTDDCGYLAETIVSWLKGSAGGGNKSVFILWAQVLPVRCPWQRPEDGVITYCNPNSTEFDRYYVCTFWNATIPKDPSEATPAYFANILGVRVGGIVSFNESTQAYGHFNNTIEWNQTYQVRAIFNQTSTITRTTQSLFYLLLTMLILTLVGLTVMRGDARRLVLDPLQRMLKIVIRYAEDPLSQTDLKKPNSRKSGGEGTRAQQDEEELGNYETEQLINAISKIADLLRKCWGVAGAGIISENLRTKDGKTVVFNPMVKGKRVYALFGFIAINDFSKLLRDLDNDVMILINDVARVVHDEVYRWALGDSGQCNKNLGSAFLMVFRIGDFSEVHAKKKRATDVVFNSQMKRNLKPLRGSISKRGAGKRGRRAGGSRHFDIKTDGTLQLASLPGIQSFTDRALLGLLKSFAGIHRDKKLRTWRTDFRISGGVGAFTANVIYGMDAGWAVEGAVGSEYKIDATYLSPHVNMASRMMSAAKQYGVTILLSQAVEELLSKNARDKLRHLDTVYVKGSSVAQRIFTYDARFQGVDFFLYERPPDQADIEAETYTPGIWDVDQDLRAMRQHVTDEFMIKFRKGVEQYLEGEWKKAIQTLHEADNIMIQTVLEQGYIEFDIDGLENEVFRGGETNDEITRIRNEVGDGSSKCLIQFMQRRNAIAPEDWHGVRKLMSK